jgi:hypothetical protein
MIYRQPIAAAVQIATKEKPRNVVWERVLTVDYYKSTLSALTPVIQLVDNPDLLKISSLKKGRKKVRLSLLDLWEDDLLPFPSVTQAYDLISADRMEPAGIIELTIFAQILKTEKVLINHQELLILAIRQYNLLGNIRALPSLTRESEYGIMLGLTYDWMAKKCHALYLVVEY